MLEKYYNYSITPNSRKKLPPKYREIKVYYEKIIYPNSNTYVWISCKLRG